MFCVWPQILVPEVFGGTCVEKPLAKYKIGPGGIWGSEGVGGMGGWAALGGLGGSDWKFGRCQKFCRFKFLL